MYTRYCMNKEKTESPKFHLEIPSMGDAIAERKGKNMGDTIILAIYFPIIIGGMLGVIIWGMSAAGIRHGESDRPHLRT